MKPFTKRLALVMGLLFTALISTAPLEAVNHNPHRGVVNAKRPANFSLRHARPMEKPDCSNQRPAQLGVAVLFSATPPPSTLLVPILVVFRGCAEKQVERIGAGAIVAGMENALAGRYRATVQHPRRPMSRKVTSYTIAEFSVSKSGNASIPSPAITQTGIVRMWWPIELDFGPKPFIQGFGKPLRSEIFYGNRQLHSVSVFDCLPSLRLVSTVRGQLRLESQASEGFAI